MAFSDRDAAQHFAKLRAWPSTRKAKRQSVISPLGSELYGFAIADRE